MPLTEAQDGCEIFDTTLAHEFEALTYIRPAVPILAWSDPVTKRHTKNRHCVVWNERILAEEEIHRLKHLKDECHS